MRKYILRYTPYGPPRDRLALILEVANLDRRENTSPYSLGALTPLHSCEEVVESLHKLKQIRTDSDRRCFGDLGHHARQADRMSPTGNFDDGVNVEEGSPQTQLAYGTQTAHLIQAPSISTEVRTERVTQAPNGDTAKQLLDLLNYNKPVAPKGSVHASQRAGRSLEEAHSGPQATRKERLDPKTPSRVGSSSEDLPHTDLPKAPSAGGFTRTSISHVPSKQAGPPTDRLQSARLPPSYPRDNASGAPPPSVVMNGSLATRREGIDQEDDTVGSFSNPQTSEDDLPDTEPAWLKATCRADGCGRVPRAQQKLLSSWQKRRAGTNSGFPDANIPINVLTALKRFQKNAASSDIDSSDEENSAASNAVSPDQESEASPDDEDSDEISWPSSSPIAESPKAPYRPGWVLPPDSSLPDKSPASQNEPRDASPVQEAQRVVDIPSSNEQTSIQAHLSLHSASNVDDSDVDMEIDVPRGLEEHNLARHVIPSFPAVQKLTMVQVKETPYSKEKTFASASNVGVAPQGEQQNSSGTSKVTSSTSIIYGTYHEPSSSAKSNIHAAETLPPSSAIPMSSYEGHMDPMESETVGPVGSAVREPAITVQAVDVHMDDANAEPHRPSPRAKHEGQHEHERYSLSSPSKPLDNPNPRLESNQRGLEDEMPVISSYRTSPVSGQMPHPEPSIIAGTTHAKRKLENSPSKRSCRPSKRNREIKYMGFGATQVKSRHEERNEEVVSYQDRKERQRTASLGSDFSGSDTKPGARSLLSPGAKVVDSKLDNQSTGFQTHFIAKANLPERKGLAAMEKSISSADQSEDLLHQGLLHSTISGTEQSKSDFVPEGGSNNSNRHNEAFLTALPESSDDVEMVIDDAELEETETETTSVEKAAIDIMPSRAVPFRATSKEAQKVISSYKPITIFETFKVTYPTYTGDSRHFLGQCKQMEKLDSEDKMVPKWQWDDFIIRNRTDYREYANDCLDRGEDAEPYYRFYKDSIRDTLFTENIVTSSKTLRAAIEELEGGAAAHVTVPGTPNARLSHTEATAVRGSSSSSPCTRINKADASLAARNHAKASSSMNGAESSPVTDKVHIVPAPTSKLGAPATASPSSRHEKKSRQSLPSAFDTRHKGSGSAAPRSSKELPRQSLPPSSERRLPISPPSSSLSRSVPAKSTSRTLARGNVSTQHRSLQRTSSGPRVPAASTGDPYRDFVIGLNRATSHTGDSSVRSSLRSTPVNEGKDGKTDVG